MPTKPPTDLAGRVRELVEYRVKRMGSWLEENTNTRQLFPGKMLRTRLVGRLVECESVQVDASVLEAVCAATEIVHTASLCHDDVVDNALIRRSQPTLWWSSGPSAAVLVGDLLLCEAMQLLSKVAGGRYVEEFIAKLSEVVAAETEQELVLRGEQLDEETCLRLARGKTGPLFAFVASVCGGDDEALCGVLEEAGYRIGTAYQLADDVIDILGDEQAAGKTLGTDSTRGKCTFPQILEQGWEGARERVVGLCCSAIDCADAYPDVRTALKRFLLYDLQPVLEKHSKHLHFSADIAM